MIKKCLTNNLLFLLILLSTSLSSTKAEVIKSENINNEANNLVDKNYLKKKVSDFYILGPGDTLQIIVSPEYPELNQVTTIDGNGFIVVKKLNRVYVQGLTINELNQALNESYLQYVKFPSLSTRVVNYRPLKIYLDGEVENPGLHILPGYTKLNNLIRRSPIIENPSTEGEFFEPNNAESLNSIYQDEIFDSFYFPTVFDAIREAGGLTYFSDISKIEVIRVNPISNGSGFIQRNLNFEKVFSDNSSENIRIYDGDKIIINKSKDIDSQKIAKAIRSNINPKFINVFVNGRVKLPGKKTLPKISSMNDALMLSGGPKVIRGSINLISFSNKGLVEKRKLRYNKNAINGSKQNPFLKSNDIIFVGDNILSTSSEVISEVTKPFQGLLSVYGLVKAIN